MGPSLRFESLGIVRYTKLGSMDARKCIV